MEFTFHGIASVNTDCTFESNYKYFFLVRTAGLMRYLFLWDMMQWFPTFQDNVAVQPSKLKSPSSSVAEILNLEDEITMHSSVTVTPPPLSKNKKADLDMPYFVPVTLLTTFQTLAASFQDTLHT